MKQVFLFVLSSIILFSCQKEISLETATGSGGGGGGTGGGGNSTYYMQAKINGTLRKFNFNNLFILMDVGGGDKALSLGGSFSSDPSNMEGIGIQINFQGISPASGTYTEEHTGIDYIVAGVYNPGSTTTVYGAGVVFPSVSPLVVTITKYDNTVVEGTFKGAFYKMDIGGGSPPSTEYLNFTEGSFRLPKR